MIKATKGFPFYLKVNPHGTLELLSEPYVWADVENLVELRQAVWDLRDDDPWSPVYQLVYMIKYWREEHDE